MEKANIFRGDLSDVWAETATLVVHTREVLQVSNMLVLRGMAPFWRISPYRNIAISQHSESSPTFFFHSRPG